MAMLASAEKMGYYPVQPKTQQWVLDHLRVSPDARVHLLDPCAGKAVMLAAMTARLRDLGASVISFGVEISYGRAAEAAPLVDTFIEGDWRDVSCTPESFQAVWLNPPYDFDFVEKDEKSERLEFLFLKSVDKILAPGGVLFYLVPRAILANKKYARYLASHYEGVRVYREPEGEYEQFQQVLVIGRRREQITPNAQKTEQLVRWGTSDLPPALDEVEDLIDIPPAAAGARPARLIRLWLDDADAVALAARAGAHATPEWRNLQAPPDSVDFQPAVPLRRGHLAMLLASGAMGTVRLSNGWLVKGRSEKIKRKILDDEENLVTIEEFQTKVTVLKPDGSFEIISSAQALERFLVEYGAEIATLIAGRYQPLYSGPTAAEWKNLHGFFPGRKLPGLDKTGLLPAQRHVALAAARVARKYGFVNVVAEQGFGKGSVSLAILKTLNAWPAVLLCPPHLTPKWKREVSEALPGAKAVIVKRPDDLRRVVENAGHWQTLPSGKRKWVYTGGKLVVILSNTMARNAPGWQNRPVVRQRRWVDGDGEEHTTKLLTCPQCGRVLVDDEGIPLETPPTKHKLFCSNPACTRPARHRVPRRDGKEWPRQMPPSPTYQFGKAGDLNSFKKSSEAWARGEFSSAPIHTDSVHRWMMARFIRDKYPWFFKALVADEVHMYKDKSSIQAQSFGHLIGVTKYQVTLTGTFFGGKSSSIFWLLHRLDASIRDDFDFQGEADWSAKYGRLKEIKKRNLEGNSSSSGTAKWTTRTKEMPGISPQIVSRVLPTTLFARIGDLGYKLPAYSEEVVRLDMDDGQYLDYVSLYNDLYAQVTAWQKGRASWVSAWASWSLNRPNSCFRPEKVRIKEPYPSKEYFLWRTLPPVTPAAAVDPDKPWFPKDVWLREFCMAEKRQGRKTLVFFRQTDTRDIQPHVKAALEDAGLRVKILPKTIEADKREAWIRKHVDDIDVLITHPKKVETGLDLVEFQNAVFYEIEYSLYTLQQAMRRVWRLGQTQPVKIVYLVYRHCFESAAFALMKEKMKAASLLYGDDAASAMEDETDEAGKSVQGDGFLTELASRILAGEQFDDGGITGLLDLTASGEAWNEPAFAEGTADASAAEAEPTDESDDESDDAGAEEESIFEMEMPARPATSGVAWWALRQSMLQGGQLPSRRKSPPRSRKERVQPDIFAEVDDGPMVVQGMLF